MQVFDGITQLPHPPDWLGCVLSIGNFDGVHLGHQRLLAELRAAEARHARPALVMTFDPHPAAVLGRGGPPWLVPLSRRLELLGDLGVSAAVVIGADRSFFAQTAQAFVQEVLIDRLRISAIVEGPDFRFGMDRAGTLDTLRSAGARAGFEVLAVPPVQRPLVERTQDGTATCPISSSLIRQLIADGRMAEAAVALGRPVELEGRVIPGRRRGRALGFPTANLDLSGRVLPAAGVYSASATILGEGTLTRPAAVFAGSPPTFAGEPTRVEAHLLDFAGDLYGRTLRLHVRDRLRGLTAFAEPAALARQIAEDLHRIRESSSAAGGA